MIKVYSNEPETTNEYSCLKNEAVLEKMRYSVSDLKVKAISFHFIYEFSNRETVQQSPVSSVKQKGNLTGNVRLLRDHVGDICSLIHQWNNDLVEGASVITDIKRFMHDRMSVSL